MHRVLLYGNIKEIRTMKEKHNMQCPCQSGLEYQDCCQPLHQYQKIASTAEQLMRSVIQHLYWQRLIIL